MRQDLSQYSLELFHKKTTTKTLIHGICKGNYNYSLKFELLFQLFYCSVFCLCYSRFLSLLQSFYIPLKKSFISPSLCRGPTEYGCEPVSIFISQVALCCRSSVFPCSVDHLDVCQISYLLLPRFSCLPVIVKLPKPALVIMCPTNDNCIFMIVNIVFVFVSISLKFPFVHMSNPQYSQHVNAEPHIVVPILFLHL